MLYRLIAQKQQGDWNQLAFIIAVLAFTIVAEILSVQLAVGIGIEEYKMSASPGDQDLYSLVPLQLNLYTIKGASCYPTEDLWQS